MKKSIAIIAATVAAFSLNAASCEQLAPTPAVNQIVTFEEAEPVPGACGIAGVQTLDGCVLPAPVPPVSEPPCTEGLCDTDRRDGMNGIAP